MATAKKTVLITGCSKDSIGDALAKEFHRRGYHVIATARSLSRLQDLKSLGIQIEELDVTSSSSIQALRSKVSELDMLINNAGGLHLGMISDVSEEQWKSVFDQNFFSAVNITQAFLPLLIQSKGTIVNHTSQNPYFAFAGTALYAVSKAALRQYTDNLRTELHPFSVRVIELVTGVVGSNIITKQMPSGFATVPESSIYAPVKAQIEKAWTGEQLGGRWSKPEDYAKRVVSDLIDAPGLFRKAGSFLGYERPWVWRGWTSTTSYWFWLFGCGWKGLWDPVWRMGGLSVLKDKLEKEKQL